ncbi:hypothetical protein DB345_21160 [Spartobacteria bacterium LR76]|nr:hypothetical protein DB345_21160 [Spartobacteria bacterium LR76]
MLRDRDFPRVAEPHSSSKSRLDFSRVHRSAANPGLTLKELALEIPAESRESKCVENSEHPHTESDLRSPFASGAPQASRRRFPYVVLLAAIGVLAAAGISYVLIRSASDPLRKLSQFPVQDYHENYNSLLGARYRAELKVSNQLGWDETKGRLITFQLVEAEKPIVALVSQNLSSMDMRAGDRIVCEIDVDQGGLLRIPYARKE